MSPHGKLLINTDRSRSPYVEWIKVCNLAILPSQRSHVRLRCPGVSWGNNAGPGLISFATIQEKIKQLPASDVSTNSLNYSTEIMYHTSAHNRYGNFLETYVKSQFEMYKYAKQIGIQ